MPLRHDLSDTASTTRSFRSASTFRASGPGRAAHRPGSADELATAIGLVARPDLIHIPRLRFNVVTVEPDQTTYRPQGQPVRPTTPTTSEKPLTRTYLTAYPLLLPT